MNLLKKAKGAKNEVQCRKEGSHDPYGRGSSHNFGGDHLQQLVGVNWCCVAVDRFIQVLPGLFTLWFTFKISLSRIK